MYICVLELLSSHYELVSVADVNARGEVVGIDLPAVQVEYAGVFFLMFVDNRIHYAGGTDSVKGWIPIYPGTGTQVIGYRSVEMISSGKRQRSIRLISSPNCNISGKKHVPVISITMRPHSSVYRPYIDYVGVFPVVR